MEVLYILPVDDPTFKKPILDLLQILHPKSDENLSIGTAVLVSFNS